MSANTMERPAENTRASEANTTVPLNPAIFESESKEQQIGLSEILLDAAVIIQIYEWMPQLQRKTPTTLLASWSLENEQHLQSTQRVWASIKARYPCCLQRRVVNDAARAADNIPVPKHNYRHRECARLAKYWRQQVRLRAVRQSNLGIALSMVRNEDLDLGSQGHLRESVQRLVDGEPVQALEDCGEKLRELARPRTSASAPSSSSSSLPPREKKSVSFSPDVLLFGQVDDARSRKSFQRHHADYVPGRWSLREVRGCAASQVQEQPEAATPITSSPGEPMDVEPMEIDPPSTPATTCSSSSSLDDDSSNDTDTYLDTSGRFQSFEAFYHHRDNDDYNTASTTSLDHHDNQRTTTTTTTTTTT